MRSWLLYSMWGNGNWIERDWVCFILCLDIKWLPEVWHEKLWKPRNDWHEMLLKNKSGKLNQRKYSINLLQLLSQTTWIIFSTLTFPFWCKLMGLKWTSLVMTFLLPFRAFSTTSKFVWQQKRRSAECINKQFVDDAKRPTTTMNDENGMFFHLTEEEWDDAVGTLWKWSHTINNISAMKNSVTIQSRQHCCQGRSFKLLFVIVIFAVYV